MVRSGHPFLLTVNNASNNYAVSLLQVVGVKGCEGENGFLEGKMFLSQVVKIFCFLGLVR